MDLVLNLLKNEIKKKRQILPKKVNANSTENSLIRNTEWDLRLPHFF